MKQITTYVGIDAHKKDLFIAMLVGSQAVPVTWTVANEANAVRRLVRKLERDAPGVVRACYEAGPCGYALQRQMSTARVSCQVIAPALAPRTRRACQNESSGCPQAGAAARRAADGGPAADAGRGSGPRSVSCAPQTYQRANTASRALRPAGATFGAPGPRVRSLTRTLLCEQADACSATAKPPSRSGLDEGSFHIRLG